ncbi:hypothetical protein KEM56_002040 [Ascosphaera pollenicola]|nr:hypothetical protein KEM56_002040 [Ascosphaera pollenicola]
MTEAEKYEKGLYQPKDKKGNKNQQKAVPTSESTPKSIEPQTKTSASTTTQIPTETPSVESARPSTSASSAPTENLGKRKRGDDTSSTKSSKAEATSLADTETVTSTKFPKSKGKQRDPNMVSPPASPKTEKENSAPASADKVERFMKLIKKNGQSDTGISVHKALKKYHKKLEVTDEKHGKGREKLKKVLQEQRKLEEEALWKSLRLKKNDRGEIVLIM